MIEGFFTFLLILAALSASAIEELLATDRKPNLKLVQDTA